MCVHYLKPMLRKLSIAQVLIPRDGLCSLEALNRYVRRSDLTSLYAAIPVSGSRTSPEFNHSTSHTCFADVR